MDTSPPPHPLAAGRAGHRRGPAVPDGAARPRIYYLSPLLAGPLEAWAPHLARVAALGFDHVLVAPPFAAGARGDLRLTGDPARIDPRIAAGLDTEAGIRRMAGLCAAEGLRLLIDVVADRIDAASPLAASRPDLFTRPVPADVIDPRRDLGGAGAAYARLESPEVTAWWAARLGTLAAAGAAGFRICGLHRAPREAIATLLPACRAAAPDARLLVWGAGLDDAQRSALEGADGVFGSLPWWDFRAAWFWDEMRALAASAGAVLAATGAPWLTAAPPAEATARRAVRFAVAAAQGWMLPMGHEFGAGSPLDPAIDTPRDWDRLSTDPRYDLSATIAAANAALADAPPGATPLPSAPPGADAIVLLDLDAADPRRARGGRIVVANAGDGSVVRLGAGRLLTAGGAVFDALHPVLPAEGGVEGGVVRAGDTLTLGPAEVRWFQATAAEAPARPAHADLAAGARTAAAAPRIGIEAITPCVDAGRFPARRVVGETVTVEADIIYDGHDQFAAVLLWQTPDDPAWREARMRPLGNDRWQAAFPLAALGRHAYTIETWRDGYATWADEVGKKAAAGVDTHVELIEGRHLVETHAAHAADEDRAALEALRTRLDGMDDDAQRALLLDPATAALMARADPRPHRVRHAPALSIVAERPGAAFASWYEIFPRSMSDDPARHGTFDDVIRHLPRVRDMGFDVLYFPPIHPIGRTNRKGRNNSLRAAPDDVGSPYAIGGAEGGHDALHPALGTLDDFRRLVDAAAGHGLELAIDFAIQCAPDHPWLAAHPGWFAWRPDGSIKYAENPPKKYEDIVNVDFYADAAKPALWVALCEVVLFWCEQGVRLFRVDNPHTKPLPFWEWMIGAVQARFPDAVFLAEAFTRPKVMYRLAKSGFGQSYTYFTWRNTKRELTEYLTELTTTAPRDFFRPHFFVNTPDINPPFLQTGGRPAHLIRAALAATLSGLWGVYCGFELCEATPLPGREEYLDSEKYQIRAWDWHRPGNIIAEIARLNALRRENPALQTHLNVRFGHADNEAILWYEKATPDRSNVILAAVSLDPHAAQSATVEVPLWGWGLPDDGTIVAENLLDGGSTVWQGKWQTLRLTPERPYALWRARPAV